MGALCSDPSASIISCNIMNISDRLNTNAFKHQLSLLRILNQMKKQILLDLPSLFYTICPTCSQICSKIVLFKDKPPQFLLSLSPPSQKIQVLITSSCSTAHFQCAGNICHWGLSNRPAFSMDKKTSTFQPYVAPAVTVQVDPKASFTEGPYPFNRNTGHFFFSPEYYQPCWVTRTI